MTVVGARWAGLVVLALAAACAPAGPGPTVTPEQLPSLEAERAAHPNDQQILVRLGAGYYRAARYPQAIAVLQSAMALGPTFPAAVFLGLSFEGAGKLDSAESAYRSAQRLDLDRAQRAELDGRLANLTKAQLRVLARQAIAQEATLTRAAPTPNAVAVMPWRYLGASPELAPLEKGIAQLITTDLSRVSSLVLLERERVQALTDELALTAAERTAPGTGARSGRLLKAARVVQGSFRDDPRSNQLRLDANVVITQSGAVAARGSASDRLAQLFSMEKQIVLDLLRQLGITLSAAERQALTERPTADLQAFLAFSRGLDAEDRGDFAGAKAQYDAAVARDPNFRAARDRSAAVATLSAGPGRSPAELADFAGRTLPGRQAPTAGRALALINAIKIVAPSSGSLIGDRALARLPIARPRLPEILRQDDPTQTGTRGTIVIVIPRP